MTRRQTTTIRECPQCHKAGPMRADQKTCSKECGYAALRSPAVQKKANKRACWMRWYLKHREDFLATRRERYRTSKSEVVDL